jgi:hypothetical protein
VTENYSEWTSCQMFGHNGGWCADCGEVSDQDIRDLGREAAEHGDYELAVLCDKAADYLWAQDICARIIRENRTSQ